MLRLALLFLIGAILLLISVPAWRLWQQRRLFMAYQRTSEALTPFQPTQRHLQAIRKLQFTWSHMIENGGPLVDPTAPYGDTEIKKVIGGIIGTSNAAAVGSFHAEVSHALVWALRHGTLPVGSYPISPLTGEVMRERIRAQLKGIPEDRIEQALRKMPNISRNDQFEFTAQHQTLLKNLEFDPRGTAKDGLFMLFGWQPAPTVDFKRPYGSSTAFENDMSYFLGWPDSEDKTQLETLERLYWDMWPALQAFVLHSQIPTTD